MVDTRAAAKVSFLGLFATAALLSLGACSSPEPTRNVDPAGANGASDHQDVGSTSQAITAADVISRAEQWSNAKLKYCQAPNHKTDYDSACSSTCNRQDNAQWDPYRSDCSGLISWAWGLPAPGRVTSGFAPYNTSVSKKIAWGDLAPGDALNSTPDEHIILFKAWKVKGQSAVFIEEPGCSTTPDYAHEYTANVTVNANGTLHVEGMDFYPIRYDSIVQQSPDWAAEYVSQTWPLASGGAIQLTVGEPKKGSISLKNTGAKTWKAGVVKLAPIPRDKDSAFAASSWLSPTRVSSVTGDVPPGSVGKFEWDLEGSKPGDFKPYFGLVADGSAWFADSGGPPDNDLQVSIHVSAAPPSGTGGSAGAPSGGAGGKGIGGSAGAPTGTGAGGQQTGGAAGKSTGTAGSAGKPTGSAGTSSSEGGASAGSAGKASGAAGASGNQTSSAGSAGETGNGGTGDDAPTSLDSPAPDSSGGCALGGKSNDAAGAGVLVGLLLLARRRRARR